MRKVTLYIIDDEPEVVAALAALFKPNKRYRIRGYSAVKDLLADLEEWPPELVICDLKMPDLDGMELLKRLKGRFPRLRSVLLTGQAFGPEIVAGMEQDLFNNYYAKPYDVAVLKETVARLAREAAKEAVAG